MSAGVIGGGGRRTSLWPGLEVEEARIPVVGLMMLGAPAALFFARVHREARVRVEEPVPGGLGAICE